MTFNTNRIAGGSFAAGTIVTLGCMGDNFSLAPSLFTGAAVFAVCEVARRVFSVSASMSYAVGVCESALKTFAGVAIATAGANYAVGGPVDSHLPFAFGALGAAVKLSTDTMRVLESEKSGECCGITEWHPENAK